MPQKKISQSGLRWLWIAIIIIGLDQLTKHYLNLYLEFDHPITVFPFFNLTLAYNTGAAFSFLNQAGGWQLILFSTIAITISLIILISLMRTHRAQVWHCIALNFIVGGALGNAIDRIMHGHVIDFLDFYINGWHWPAFNIADTFICIGAIMIIIELFLKDKQLKR